MNPFETPVLFLVFNRPEHTRKVFECIREIKPKYLFVAADGPRKLHSEDTDKCNQVREIVMKGIDWDCEVKTLFREENLGCGKAVSTAIFWFFETVEKGIILEDDCIPNSAFFRFSETLLEYFKDDEMVMHIGGGCYTPNGYFASGESYYYSKYSYSWGWATWRRAWLKFDDKMLQLEKFIDGDLKSICKSKSEQIFWAQTFADVKNGKIDTWDFKWNYSIWTNRGLCIHSTHNYIKNIGFDKDATHTTKENENYKRINVENIMEKIIHPKRVKINEKADTYVFEKYNLSKKDSLIKILLANLLNRIK